MGQRAIFPGICQGTLVLCQPLTLLTVEWNNGKSGMVYLIRRSHAYNPFVMNEVNTTLRRPYAQIADKRVLAHIHVRPCKDKPQCITL
jgi:hypothetical protein